MRNENKRHAQEMNALALLHLLEWNNFRLNIATLLKPRPHTHTHTGLSLQAITKVRS